MKLFILLFLFTSCGKLVDVTIPKKIETTAGPDFEKAIAVCDDRYGVNTQEAEKCFLDYRNFFKITGNVGPVSVEQFCSQYETEEEIQQCENNINSSIFGES